MKLSAALFGSALLMVMAIGCGNDTDDDVAPAVTPAAVSKSDVQREMNQAAGTASAFVAQQRDELEQVITQWHARLEDLRAKAEDKAVDAQGDIQVRMKNMERDLLAAEEKLDQFGNAAEDKVQNLKADVQQSLAAVSREYDDLSNRIAQSVGSATADQSMQPLNADESEAATQEERIMQSGQQQSGQSGQTGRSNQQQSGQQQTQPQEQSPQR